MNPRSLFAAYLRQQRDIAMPDLMVSPEFGLQRFIGSLRPPAVTTRPARHGSARSQAPATRPVESSAKAGDPFARLSRLKPIAPAIPARTSAGAPMVPGGSKRSLTYDEKRAIFIRLYGAKCGKCALGKSRKQFVFGAGNVDARLMIIGLAPGAGEDEVGMPLVGEALQLLNGLLEAASIDRKKEVFITTVLKCRPPDDRAPAVAEIAACLPLLQQQIEVVAPAVLLILGSDAAGVLTGAAGDLTALEGKMLDYRGIPALATCHPATLLADPELRGRFENDLQQVAKIMKESKRHGAL